MDKKTIELSSLVGIHVLSGVDFENRMLEKYGHMEDCEVVNFTIDGKTYTAVEDPDDGYRSCMEEIFESETATKNEFVGQSVLGKMREADKHSRPSDIIDFIDTITGLVVLSIGTDDYDDYYPCWVAEFNPKNMSINQDAT